MKHFTKCLKFLWLALCFVGGAGSAWAEEVTIASFSNSNTTGWIQHGSPNYSSGYYRLVSKETYFETPTIQWADYTNVTVTIKARKFGGPDATQGKISIIQDEKELGNCSPTNTTLTNYTVAIAPSQIASTILIACPGASNSKGCGISEITITGEVVASSYTISATSNNGSYGTVSISGSTITATPAEGYRVSTSSPYTVTDGEATVSQNGNVFTVTTDADCTVQINFEALPKYTVTLGDDSSTLTEESASAGVTLPVRSDVGDYTFAGWSETNVTEETTTAPTIVPTGMYAPTENVTLYPVYTRTEGGGVSEKTSSVTVSEYATANSWGSSSSASQKNIVIDENVTATCNDGTNSGKYYSDWRIYQTETGAVTITTSAGELSSATFTFTVSNTGALFYGEDAVTSGTPVEISGTSATFTVGNSGSATNGQVRITAISVTYSAASSTTYYLSAPVAATVARPVITVADTFEGSTTATITCETEGAAIKYSYDGENWNDYSEPLTITATTTIYAKAEKGGDESTVASKTTTRILYTPTVAISGDLTNDLAGETDVNAGTLSATVTYNDEDVEGATVTWTSSNTAVATINETTGAVTLLTMGSTTITAAYAGKDNEYNAASATYVLEVTDSKVPGTMANPYTVAQALDATPASGNSETVYVSGIVSRFYNTDIVTDNSHRYYISDDGTATDELMVYNGKGLNNVAFSSADDLQIGDKVVIVGQLTTYNSTKEFAKDNYIYSRITKHDNTITVAGGTEFTIDRTQDEEELTLTATATSKETVIFTVDTENTTIDANDYEFDNGYLLVNGNKGGVIIIKANAAGNENYKDAEEVTITVTVVGVKEDATIVVADDEVAYGETFTVDDSAIEGGAITVTSSNTAVATVEGLVITPVAVGTTTITVATAEDETYKAGSETFTLTVTAPEGLATAKPADPVVGSMDFTGNEAWKLPTTGTTTETTYTDGTYSVTLAGSGTHNYNTGYLFLKAGGTLTFQAFDKAVTKIEVVGRDGASGKTIENIYVGETPVSTETTGSIETNTFEIASDYQAAGNVYTLQVSTANAQITGINIYFAASGTGNVSVTFNNFGYATLCSPYPLDFTNAPGVDAYFVSEANGTQVNFKNFDCPVKGGTPLFLVGEPGSTVTIPSVDSENEPDVNQLVGTLAPTFVETVNGAYTNFGLKGEDFVKINSGVVKAGKAYLPVLTETLPAQEGAKLRLVFTDSATGIATVKEVPAAALDGILYNLGGQRVSASYKGIVIKNGKKYLNK